MQEQDIINSIIKREQNQLKCTTCQMDINCEHYDFRKIRKHFYSKKHLLKMTQQYLNLLNDQKKPEESMKFINWKLAKEIKEFSSLEYDNFLQKSINNILEYFYGIDQQTSCVYAKKIKQLLEFLVEKQLNSLTIDSAYLYLKKNCTERDYVIVKRLLKLLDFKLSDNQKKEIQNNINISKETKKIPSHLFQQFASQFLIDLEQSKHLIACFMYLLAYYGTSVKTITRASFKQLQELCKNDHDSAINESKNGLLNQSQSIQRLIQKLLHQTKLNESEPLLAKKSQREIRNYLQNIRMKLKESCQSQDYKIFLDRSSLQAFLSAKKEQKKQKALETNYKKETNTYSFLGSSIIDDSEDNDEQIDHMSGDESVSSFNSQRNLNLQFEKSMNQCSNQIITPSNENIIKSHQQIQQESILSSKEMKQIDQNKDDVNQRESQINLKSCISQLKQDKNERRNKILKKKIHKKQLSQ